MYADAANTASSAPPPQFVPDLRMFATLPVRRVEVIGHSGATDLGCSRRSHHDSMVLRANHGRLVFVPVSAIARIEILPGDRT